MHGPDVESDPATDQIFVRGTQDQIQKIRELLVKMGETGLKEPGAATAGTMRSISFRGDAKSAVEEIQRLWPQLRQNPLRVVTPSAVAPLLHQEKQEAPPTPPAPKNPPAPAPAPEQAILVRPQDAGIAPGHADRGAGRSGGCGFGSPGRDAKVSPQPAPPAAAAAPPKAKSPPPVLMAVSGDKSSSPRKTARRSIRWNRCCGSFSRQSGGPGRNYNIYLLKHAVATKVAETLQQLFRTNQQSNYLRGLQSGGHRGR